MTDVLISCLIMGSKLSIYLGIAAIIGGFFILILTQSQSELYGFIKRYIFAGTILALLAVGINFFAQVANFAEIGWAGMLDRSYIDMLWDSPVGESMLLRGVVLNLVLCLIVVAMLHARIRRDALEDVYPNKLVILLLGLGSLILAISFSLTGHTVDLNLVSHVLLSIHVFIALLWMGSLIPLWQSCRSMRITELQSLMQRFGIIAMGLVAILLLCGLILAYQLVGNINELFKTTYGVMLLLKLLLVSVILGFAAWHKWRLVPQLNDPTTVNLLQRSILLESLVGLSILMVTVLLTTFVGPMGMHE